MAAVVICTEPFLPLARSVAAQRGRDDLAIVSIPHPIAGTDRDELEQEVGSALEGLDEAFKSPPVPDRESESQEKTSELVEAPESAAAFLAFAMDREWGDGLPLFPPTEDVTDSFLAEAGLDGDASIGPVPPSNRAATLRAIVANAVMAGCVADTLPVVVAAVGAVLDPAFNLQAITTTTHPATPLVIVHGPIVDALGFNSAANTLGQGNRANATVGRALRLVLQNVGGAVPGTTDRATHGSPAKYSYCLAENAAETPWQTLHDRGDCFGTPGAVTVIGAEGLHNVNDHGSADAVGVMRHLAGGLAAAGSNNVHARGEMLLLLGPEHAQLIARDGIDLPMLQEWLIKNALVDVGGVSAGNIERFQRIAPQVFDPWPGDRRVPILDRPDDLLVLVAGGPGRHSVVIPTFGFHRAVTRLV